MLNKNKSFYCWIVKPIIDFVISLLSIIIFLPLMLIIYLFILISSNSNPIFSQQRIGKNNCVFKMYKFKTLDNKIRHYEKTESILDIEEHYIFGGKFLRLTHLDELPQLFNILLFQMSFVGPRPHIEEHAELIKLRTEAGVNFLKPGMTGLAQINARDHALSDKEKYEFDKIYKEEISFKQDLKIFFKTFSLIIVIIKNSIKKDKLKLKGAKNEKNNEQ